MSPYYSLFYINRTRQFNSTLLEHSNIYLFVWKQSVCIYIDTNKIYLERITVVYITTKFGTLYWAGNHLLLYGRSVDGNSVWTRRLIKRILFGIRLQAGANSVQCTPVTACQQHWPSHYNDVIMEAIASQISSLPIVYSTVYSRCRSKKHPSSASLAFVRGIHQWPVNSPVAGEFPAQKDSNAENVFIWWRQHVLEELIKWINKITL